MVLNVFSSGGPIQLFFSYYCLDLPVERPYSQATGWNSYPVVLLWAIWHNFETCCCRERASYKLKFSHQHKLSLIILILFTDKYNMQPLYYKIISFLLYDFWSRGKRLNRLNTQGNGLNSAFWGRNNEELVDVSYKHHNN